MELLLTGPDRPDGLIIGDDTLLEYAVNGIFAAGLRVPDDLDIVAYANFPLQRQCTVPAVRIGMNVPQLLTSCIEYILHRSLDSEAAKQTEMEAVMQDADGKPIPLPEPAVAA